MDFLSQYANCRNICDSFLSNLYSIEQKIVVDRKFLYSCSMIWSKYLFYHHSIWSAFNASSILSLLNNNTEFDTVEVVFIRMMYTPLIRKRTFSNYGTRALSFWTNLIIVYEQVFTSGKIMEHFSFYQVRI